MLDVTLAAEYRRIMVIKGISIFYWICDEPTITVFDGRNIFPIPFRPFNVLIELRPAFNFLLSIDPKKSLVQSFLLQATALIVVSIPLGGALLIFFYYMPFRPLCLFVNFLALVSRVRVFFSKYFMWNNTFDTLGYYFPEIISYLLHATTIACPYSKFIPEEGL